MRWVALLVVLLAISPARAQETTDVSEPESKQPPVGGLFGLFRKGPTPAPLGREPDVTTPAPPVPPRPRATEPAAEPTSTRRPERLPTQPPEPLLVVPTETPTPARQDKKDKKDKKVGKQPTPTPVAEEAPEEEEIAPRATPRADAEPEPPVEDEAGAREPGPEETDASAARKKEEEGAATPADRGGGKSNVRLPSVEILGELEKPDIFFVVPRARDHADEQLMRSRIRREINRPVIKDWIEEEMLLK